MKPYEPPVDSHSVSDAGILSEPRCTVQKITWAARLLSGLVMLLTPGFLLAGIMGLAREGHRGPFFFIEQAFYCSTILYPLL